ncbi:MAG: hypothetical protein WC505_07270 [Patescibacteria group bacterium]
MKKFLVIVFPMVVMGCQHGSDIATGVAQAGDVATVVGGATGNGYLIAGGAALTALGAFLAMVFKKKEV